MPPGRRLRLSLAIVGGMVLLLCMGGIGMAYALYDNATAPDRSAPDVAVDNYLRALFIERDDIAANLYVCQKPDLRAIADFRDSIRSQEELLGTSITVSWGALLVHEEDGQESEVVTAVRRSATIDGAGQSTADDWRFLVVNENGWRVCGARRAD